jgi:rod shape-determining protein MreC
LQKSNVILYLINAAIFILLEVAALNMLHNNGPLQSTWLSKGSQAVMGTVWGGAQNVKHYFSLKKSNDSLALENHDLRLRIAQFEAMLEGTQEVQAPMAADAKGKAGNFVYTPATIVKISNNSRHNYIIIGKGSNDGITKGSGVITGKGAIGVIDAVSSNF